MKGGKEEEKLRGPLFPRLHVNDADKGGPRAPPRNKMALYEQLSIPSQRFNPTSAPALPLPLHNGSTLVPSASKSQGYGHDRNVLPSFHIPCVTPAHSVDKVHSRSADGVNHNTARSSSEKRATDNVKGSLTACSSFPTKMQSEKRFTDHANGSLSAPRAGDACISFRPHGSSHGKKPNKNKFDDGNGDDDDDDDFRVPTFDQPGNIANQSKDITVLEAGKGTPDCTIVQQSASGAAFTSPVQFTKSCDKPMEQSGTSDIKSRKVGRTQSGEKHREDLPIKENKEDPVPHLDNGESLAAPSQLRTTSLDCDHPENKNVSEKPHDESMAQHQKFYGNGASCHFKCLADIHNVECGDGIRTKNGSCSTALLDNNHQSPKVRDKFNEMDENTSEPLEVKNAEGNDEASDASMVDSLPGIAISPDDVVRIIGLKHFWKARRAIVNQQRVFAVQVFELHRLIKVQKSISASPHILLEGNPYLNRSSQASSTKEMQYESFTKSQPKTARQRDGSQNPNQSTDCLTEKPAEAQLVPSHENGPQGQNSIQNLITGPSSGNLMPFSIVLDQKPNAWCFPTPSNQWLVPIMSPTEGLIYKPYAGPCPPTGGFMAPVYGGCGPMSLPAMPGDAMNPVYGMSASHQQQNRGLLPGANPVAPKYYPAPYPVPVANSMAAVPTTVQAKPSTASQPHGQTEQGSCNASNLKSSTLSGRVSKFQGSKESELQGSTGSSPHAKHRTKGRNALPLFPVAPAPEDSSAQPSPSSGRENRTLVIKVVPHNASSASASAARIFRSIQEERQQQDS